MSEYMVCDGSMCYMGGVTEHDGDYDWYARQLRARG